MHFLGNILLKLIVSYFGFSYIYRTKFGAFSDIDNFSIISKFSFFDIDKLPIISEIDLSAFDNFSSIYRTPLGPSQINSQILGRCCGRASFGASKFGPNKLLSNQKLGPQTQKIWCLRHQSCKIWDIHFWNTRNTE